ncbi:MAG: CHASE2 domain-containing protein [Candidatus Omnitrophota bacterium]
MKITKNFFVNVVLAVTIASLVLLLSAKGVLSHFELSGLDLLFHLKGPSPYNNKVIIVEITDADIEKIGRWPWDRSWSAAMISALDALGARSVYFDIVYAEASDEKDDMFFEEALKALTKTSVYLPSVFQSENFITKELLPPLLRFSAYTKGTGAINIYPDSEGTIRRIPLVFKTEKGVFPHMALKVAMDYDGLSIKEVTPQYLLLSGAKKDFKIPFADKYNLFVNWTGLWKSTFKHYDFLDILAAYQAMRTGAEVDRRVINPDDFKDSICVVGLTAIGLYDIKPIPLEAQYPGVGIVANVISNILDRDFIRVVPRWVDILTLYFLAILAALIIRGEKPFKESLYSFLFGSFYFAATLFFFKKDVLINFPVPLLGFFSSYLVVESFNFMRIAIERRNFFKMAVTDGLTGLYNIRYFKMLLEAELHLAKPDTQRQFAVVMSDVDHFKKFSDTYGHQVGDLVLKEVANALKRPMRASDLVARYGGEEMIVLLRGVSLADAMSLAEKLRKSIEDSVVKDQNATYKVTASLGVSIFKPGDTVDSLIKRADDGLYKSKEAGRNKVSSVE